MTFDTTVPTSLKEIQQWFASIITQPIDDENHINALSPTGHLISEEAALHIAPSPTLQPAQRIELYSQQYWWRLLSNMQESFPLVTRLFGYYAFNKTIAIPYLQKYPSDHWSLSYLGERLPKWIEENYHENDKALILDAARLDYAYIHSFLVEQKPFVLEAEAAEISEKKLLLQPHVQLYCFPYDIFQFRMEFLKQEPEHWVENDFPSLLPVPENKYFVLYRNFTNQQVVFHSVEESEYRLLSFFLSPCSVDAICDWLETQPNDSHMYQQAQSQLHLWFQRWIGLQWLYVSAL